MVRIVHMQGYLVGSQPHVMWAWGRLRLFTALLAVLVLGWAGSVGVTSASARATRTGKCDGLKATIAGTPHNDTIRGTRRRDVIQAGKGNDKIFGLGGNDVICGGRGNDRISGGPGRDTIAGNEGNDVIDGGSGNDTMSGGIGNDSLVDHSGSNTIFGGPGNDVVTTRGTKTHQHVYLGDGSDHYIGGDGGDVVTPDTLGAVDTGDPDETDTANPPGGQVGPPRQPKKGHAALKPAADDPPPGTPPPPPLPGGNDVVNLGAGNDQVLPGPGNDVVIGGPGNDAMAGGAGNDALAGGPGNDAIAGGDGHDQVDGGLGQDNIDGGAGGDSLTGGPQSDHSGDHLDGASSVDALYASGGNSTLNGGSGDDVIFGGPGSDNINGGSGYDSTYPSQGTNTCSDIELDPANECATTGGVQDFSLPTDGAPQSGTCSYTASPDGDDGAAGDSSHPFRTVEHLVNSLRPGQTGCLRAGSRGAAFQEADFQIDVRAQGTPASPITVRTEPGSAPATVSGRVLVCKDARFIKCTPDGQGAHDIIFAGIRFDGRNPLAALRGVGAALPSPTVDGDRITFRNDDVSNSHTATCFVVGSVLGFGHSNGTRIVGNRIRDCGVVTHPLPNSGDSGIDVEGSTGAVVSDNYIFDNADRGILLYPDVQNASIDHNVLDGNGRALSFGGDVASCSPNACWDAPSGTKVYPNNNLVTGNVISNSSLDYSDEHWQVEGYYPWYPSPPQPSGNSVDENCFFEADTSKNIQSPPFGFAPGLNNVTAVSGPGYANRAAKDFRLSGAPGTCATTFGPRG